MKLYRVLGDIAYEARGEDGNPAHVAAVEGEIVQLTAKDAAALVARGSVVLHADAPAEVLSVTPSNRPRALKE